MPTPADRGLLPQDFDANATSQVTAAAWAAYRAQAAAPPGDAAARAAWILGARQQVAAALGGEAEEVFFTSGGTHADRVALLLGTVAQGDVPGPLPILVTSALEHAAVRDFAGWLHGRGLCEARAWPVDGDATAAGTVALPPPAAVLAGRPHLVSVLLAQNETGVLQPLAQVAQAAHGAGAWVHTDAVQAVGRVAVNVAALGVDLLSLAGHKVGAVGGIGVLWVGRHSPLHARLGAELARSGAAPPPHPVGPLAAHLAAEVAGVVAATENLPGIASLVAALQALPAVAERRRTEALRDHFEARLVAELGPDVCQILGGGQPRLGNTSALLLHGAEAEAVLMALDLAGFAISAGAACASGALEPSPSLLAMGLSATAARQVVRISFPNGCNEADVEALQAALVRCVRCVRQSRGP